MRIVALLPMKAHSKRIPNKNIRQFNGKPLFHWILNTLMACPSIDLIYIDTDSKAIMKDVEKNFNYSKIRIAIRPKKLRGDDVSMNDIIRHDIQNVEADIYLQTHVTNPLLTITTIEQAILTFVSSWVLCPSIYDSLFSVTPLNVRLWSKSEPLNHEKSDIPCTQKLDPSFMENSNIYIFTKESFLENNHRIGKNPIMFEMSKEEAWDIDEMIDFEIAEFLCKRRAK